LIAQVLCLQIDALLQVRPSGGSREIQIRNIYRLTQLNVPHWSTGVGSTGRLDDTLVQVDRIVLRQCWRRPESRRTLS
jgi:hypothetical protein